MIADVRRVLRRLGIEGETYGDHLVALCPYHVSRKPHWRIRLSGPRRGLHWCFSCNEGGDLYDLVMHVRQYATRAAAVGWVEENFGEVTEEDLTAPTLEVVAGLPGRKVFRLPRGVVVGEPLAQWPTLIREYVEGRGIEPWQVERWRIGYAVDGRLQGRIVLPIHNAWGELASYVGRAWREMPKRYLYPREEEGPDPDVMFGEAHWPRAMQQRGTCVVLEGAIKALAVERAVQHVSIGAIGGSGVTLLQVTKLGTFRKVVVFTDADAAGEKAGFELQAGLSGLTEVERVRLPPGEDADSVPRERVRELLWPSLS